jgi:glycosyltransferase involved in cell wall biosynthesis
VPTLQTTIYTVNMGTGLQLNGPMLGGLLTNLGHEVHVHDIRKGPREGSKPDCAIFFERFDARCAGRFNVFIPNHEWIRPEDLPLLPRFELVACKTHEAMRALSPRIAKDRLIYIGWTTLDRRRMGSDMKFDQCLHIAGCSAQKGTDAVLQAWRENPDLPQLTVIDWSEKDRGNLDLPNLRFITDRVRDEDLVSHMNRCGVHICPSTTEGFGHTIHEAMACAAVLITTDAPPMNEGMQDCAVLVKPSRQGTMGLATTYHVDSSHLTAAVRNVMTMENEKRRDLGRAARKGWEANRANFIRSIENMAKMIQDRIAHPSGATRGPKNSGLGSNQFRA